MNSANQLETGMDVSYAAFLVPIQEGLNKRYVVQQLLAHAGDDPKSNLIKVPTNANLAVLDYSDNSVQFYKESYYREGCRTILCTKEVPTGWASIQDLKKSIINKGFHAKILWERGTPAPEESTSEYLDVNLNYELVLRTQYEAAHSNSTLIPVPADAEMAAVFLDEPLCFYKQVGDTVFAKDIQDTSWIPTNWVSLDTLKEHSQRNKYTYWVRNTPEVHECMDKIKPSSTESTFRTASEIADAALQHIKERAATYDSPEGERSALKTATAFNAVTGKNITEAEVFLLLQILKDVRQWQVPHKTHKDSIEDCIAYAALKAEAIEWQNTDPFYGLF